MVCEIIGPFLNLLITEKGFVNVRYVNLYKMEPVFRNRFNVEPLAPVSDQKIITWDTTTNCNKSKNWCPSAHEIT